MVIRVFTAWDGTTKAIKKTLESLSRHPPPGFQFDVPLLQPTGGEIFGDHVVPRILAADRILVLADLPNANVGFEAGMAYGLGRDVAIVVQRTPRPEWLQRPPFNNFVVESIDGPDAVKRLLEQHDVWRRRDDRRGTATGVRDPNLFLCPSRFEGQSCEAEKRALGLTWREVPDFNFTFNDLPSVTHDVQRLIWTVTSFGEGSDERDGGENAANGVIAGWFCAGIIRRHGSLTADAMDELRSRFRVLRSEEARAVADVGPFEWIFGTMEAFANQLTRLRDTPLSNMGSSSPESGTSEDVVKDVIVQIEALLRRSLTPRGVRRLASGLSPAGRDQRPATELQKDKDELIRSIVTQITAPGGLTDHVFLTLQNCVPSAKDEIGGLAVKLQGDAPPPTARPPALVEQTTGSILGTAHRLDRTTQWGQILDHCQRDEHSLFLLRGESRQGLGLFLERLNHYLAERVRGSRVYNVPLRIEHERAESGADWERRISHALAPGRRGTLIQHLANATATGGLFLILGLRPLHDLTPPQEEGLREFLTQTYPVRLFESHVRAPIRLLLPIDYEKPEDTFPARADAWALEGEHRHAAMVASESNGIHRRRLQYVKLNPVGFPTWDEVMLHLESLRPRPSADIVDAIRKDFDVITAPGGSATFRELADRLDRRLGAI
jgi:hypothetical protein